MRHKSTWLLLALFLGATYSASAADYLRELQVDAVEEGKAEWGHWGPDPTKYSSWQQHTNRLVPIYTFGITHDSVHGEHSAYRDPTRLKALYGKVPEETLNPEADYFDQTAVYELQKQAAASGKRYVILIVFDGMDWQTSKAAAIYHSGQVGASEGRGSGLAFLDDNDVESDFRYFVCSPHNHGTEFDVDAQTITNVGGQYGGGYAASLAGDQPWSVPRDPQYIIGQSRQLKQAYTDSASSATSLCAGVKTYNRAVNVDFEGRQVEPIARTLQKDGWSVGVVTSVPISHATPACAYANNVARYDYQDISRDLLGLKNVAHKTEPLDGVDVLIGAGSMSEKEKDRGQGANFVPGNAFVTEGTLEEIDRDRGGRYVVVQRTGGVNGSTALLNAARTAAAEGARLFGMFGVGDARGSHLPFRTADGRYNPTVGVGAAAEVYHPSDVYENPSLADMTRAALTVLERRSDRFWLMIEPGDVDWANHANNIDNSVGAVKSGDDAFRAVVEWVQRRDAWQETAVIVTADHGHYLVLDKPEMLVRP